MNTIHHTDVQKAINVRIFKCPMNLITMLIQHNNPKCKYKYIKDNNIKVIL